MMDTLSYLIDDGLLHLKIPAFLQEKGGIWMKFIIAPHPKARCHLDRRT